MFRFVVIVIAINITKTEQTETENTETQTTRKKFVKVSHLMSTVNSFESDPDTARKFFDPPP